MELDATQQWATEQVALNLRRLSAVTNTLIVLRQQMVDPIDIDRRADLLIAVEELIQEAGAITSMVRDLAWQDSTTEPTEIENK